MPTLPQPPTLARRRLIAGGAALLALAGAPLLSACGGSEGAVAGATPTQTERILAPDSAQARVTTSSTQQSPPPRTSTDPAADRPSRTGTPQEPDAAPAQPSGAPPAAPAQPSDAPPAAPAPSAADRLDGSADAGAASPDPLPRQTVHLTRATALRAGPGGRVLARLAPRTEFGSPTVLPVLRAHDGWLEVRSVALPNGRTGWISSRAALEWHGNRWRVDVSLRRREVVVQRAGREVSRFPVAIGSPSTPTPTGRFAVTDKLTTGSPTSPYGCCILALSGRQTQTPQGWGGGDRLAIHGTNLPETIGTRASLGCLRAPEDAIRRAVSGVPLGTIVTIRA